MVKGFHAGKGVASALVLSLVLVACGGGSDNDDSTPAATPSSASSASSAPSSSSSSSDASSSDASSSDASSSDASSSAPSTGTSWVPTFSAVSAQIAVSDPAANGNADFPAMTAAAIVDGIELFSPSSKNLRLYKHETDGTYAINFNGSSLATLGDVGTVVDVSGNFRYIAAAAVSNGDEVRVTYTYTGSGSCTANCATSRIALVDAGGNVLASKANLPDLTGEDTISATATSAGKMYVLFSRNTGEGGGIRVWSVTQ